MDPTLFPRFLFPSCTALRKGTLLTVRGHVLVSQPECDLFGNPAAGICHRQAYSRSYEFVRVRFEGTNICGFPSLFLVFAAPEGPTFPVSSGGVFGVFFGGFFGNLHILRFSGDSSRINKLAPRAPLLPAVSVSIQCSAHKALLFQTVLFCSLFLLPY